MCSPYLEGDIVNGAKIMFGEDQQLLLIFNCSRPGISNINVSVELENFPPLEFGMKKFFGGSLLSIFRLC